MCMCVFVVPEVFRQIMPVLPLATAPSACVKASTLPLSYTPILHAFCSVLIACAPSELDTFSGLKGKPYFLFFLGFPLPSPL